jgi:hypothetical protein
MTESKRGLHGDAGKLLAPLRQFFCYGFNVAAVYQLIRVAQYFTRCAKIMRQHRSADGIRFCVYQTKGFDTFPLRIKNQRRFTYMLDEFVVWEWAKKTCAR